MKFNVKTKAVETFENKVLLSRSTRWCRRQVKKDVQHVYSFSIALADYVYVAFVNILRQGLDIKLSINCE